MYLLNNTIYIIHFYFFSECIFRINNKKNEIVILLTKYLIFHTIN